jgi:hypothetical protein
MRASNDTELQMARGSRPLNAPLFQAALTAAKVGKRSRPGDLPRLHRIGL